MSFPQDALGHEEDLILHRHPHWKMLVLPVLTFLVATLLAGFLVGLIGRSLESTARYRQARAAPARHCHHVATGSRFR